MKANAFKVLCLLLIFTFAIQGYGECNVKNITLDQLPAYLPYGTTIGSQVTVRIDCPCAVSDIKVACPGFESLTPVDSSKFKKTGDLCLLNDGNPLRSDNLFSFVYYRDNQYDFKVVSAKFGRCN